MSQVAELDTATRGHHPDSPSSLQASEACPLFENEQRESQASADGVLQHKATETRDLTILEGNQDWEVAVQNCIDYEDRIIEELTDSVPDTMETVRRVPPTIIREKYLQVGDDIVRGSDGKIWHGITGGFPDTLIIRQDGLHAAVPDWKFGKVPVTPTKDNVQGISYALGAFHLLPGCRSVTVHFYAPHQRWSPEEQLEKYVHTFHRDEIPALELRVRTIVARKHAANEDLAKNPDDWSAAQPKTDLCIWCARKGRCAKNVALALSTVSKYEKLELPAVLHRFELKTPEQFGIVYEFMSQVETIAKAIRKRCIEAALTEDKLPPGFSLIRRQDREVTDLEALFEAAKRHGVSKKEVMSVLTIPISKVEELVKKKASKGLGAAAVRGFGDTLEQAEAVKLGNPVHFLRKNKSPAEKEKQEAIEV